MEMVHVSVGATLSATPQLDVLLGAGGVSRVRVTEYSATEKGGGVMGMTTEAVLGSHASPTHALISASAVRGGVMERLKRSPVVSRML